MRILRTKPLILSHIRLITFNGHLDNMSLSTALKPFHPWRTNKVIWIHESLNTFFFNRFAFRVITLQLKLYDTLWGGNVFKVGIGSLDRVFQKKKKIIIRDKFQNCLKFSPPKNLLWKDSFNNSKFSS